MESTNKVKGTVQVTVCDPAGIMGQKDLFATFDITYSE